MGFGEPNIIHRRTRGCLGVADQIHGIGSEDMVGQAEISRLAVSILGNPAEIGLRLENQDPGIGRIDDENNTEIIDSNGVGSEMSLVRTALFYIKVRLAQDEIGGGIRNSSRPPRGSKNARAGYWPNPPPIDYPQASTATPPAPA